MEYITVLTPDDTKFQISILPQNFEKEFDNNILKPVEEVYLNIKKRPAYYFDNDNIIYKQGFGGPFFIFPHLSDFSMGMKGKTYFDASFQLNSERDNIYFSFSLSPHYAHLFKSDIVRQIEGYYEFDKFKFFQLKNGACIMIRDRTQSISEGYWYPSLKDFDYFYYILSGFDRPKLKA